MVIHELETRGAGPVRFDETSFALHIGGDHLYLANFYAMFCAAPASERHGIAVNTAQQWLQRPAGKPADFAAARTLLRPSVRSRAYYDASNLKMEAEGIPHRIEPFGTLGAHLALGLVLDYPQTVELVDADDLKKWNVTFEEALEIAKENLREAAVRSFESRNGLYVSTWDDSYDATRILLPDLIKPLQVQGSHVALLPHRNLLLVAGSEDTAALIAMTEAARKTFEQPQPICASPLLLENGQWIDWEVPAGHPAYGAFRLLQIQRMKADYEEQENLLNGVALRRNEEIFVSNFDAMRKKDSGELITFTSWTDGVPSLLPEVDQICFVRVQSAKNIEGLGWVKWDEVMRIAPQLLERTEHYPPRWRAKQFPTASQLKFMKKEE